MKASKFYLLKDIKGDSDFHRKIGKHNVKGVYFWGFTLNDKALLPVNKNELVIYYIGKDTKSVVRRIMEEVTQLIFGGYGTIIDHDWLKNNPHNAGIYKKQESDNKGTKALDKEVLHKSDGLHVLYDFFNNTKIQPTIDWMRERLILSWIEVSDKEEIDPLELEMHDYVKSNILGTKGRVNFPHNNKFTAIDWNENIILKEWLEEVKSKLTSP
jgi:hypothetical protein